MCFSTEYYNSIVFFKTDRFMIEQTFSGLENLETIYRNNAQSQIYRPIKIVLLMLSFNLCFFFWVFCYSFWNWFFLTVFTMYIFSSWKVAKGQCPEEQFFSALKSSRSTSWESVVQPQPNSVKEDFSTCDSFSLELGQSYYSSSLL